MLKTLYVLSVALCFLTCAACLLKVISVMMNKYDTKNSELKNSDLLSKIANWCYVFSIFILFFIPILNLVFIGGFFALISDEERMSEIADERAERAGYKLKNENLSSD